MLSQNMGILVNWSSWRAVPGEHPVIHQLQLRFAYSSTVSTHVPASEFLFFKTSLSMCACLALQP